MDNKNKNTDALLNIVVNIILPVTILTKFSKRLGPLSALIIAVSIPLVYGIYEIIKNKKANFISILGLISVILTGGISLLNLPTSYLAIKEAAIPLLIGVVVFISTFTKFPILNMMLFKNEIFNTDKIEEKISLNANEKHYQSLKKNANILLSFSFILSAVLNYVLAKMIVKSPSGTEAFNEELGKMNALSLPVIAIPSMLVLLLVFFYLIKMLKKLTGLSQEEMMNIK
jgi:hypothetical protein